MTDRSDAESRQQAILDCWFLTGATASGKTSVGLELAKKINAEIISLDSMAIYRGMDIGTAKPTEQQAKEVKHHLIDIVNPNESFSVSDYLAKSWDAIQEIRGRGKEVLFVGGTPLYLKSLLRGMFDGPPADWEIRNQIEKEVEEFGIEWLRQRLEMIDPLSAHKLHPNDKRRMIRALEVYRKTGQPISHLQREFERENSPDRCRVFVMHWPREILHERIESRVLRMFEEGFVAEVQSLLDRYDELGRTASQAVGYQEVIAHLREDLNLEETVAAVMSRTRQFARRQETWFRGLKECRWIELEEPLDSTRVVEQVLEFEAKRQSDSST